MPSHPNQPPKDDRITLAPAGEPRLARATARAQKRLPEFIAMLREQPSGVRFFVKAAFRRSDGTGHKHMWVRVSRFDGDAFVGSLDSDPQGGVDASAGQAVRIPVADTEDWMYDRDGSKRTGEFSAPVLDQIEREKKKRR